MNLEQFLNSASVVSLATAYTMIGAGVISIVAEYVVGDTFHNLAEIAKRRVLLVITLFLAGASYLLSCSNVSGFVSCDTHGVLTIAASVFVSLLGGSAASAGLHALTKRA